VSEEFTGRAGTEAVAAQLLADQQRRWERRPYEFLRAVPSHPDSPLSYYRERAGITFLLHLRTERTGDDRVELLLTAENQPGCLAFLRRAERRSVRFTVRREG
jgi:hypothetical protein